MYNTSVKMPMVNDSETRMMRKAKQIQHRLRSLHMMRSVRLRDNKCNAEFMSKVGLRCCGSGEKVGSEVISACVELKLGCRKTQRET